MIKVSMCTEFQMSFTVTVTVTTPTCPSRPQPGPASSKLEVKLEHTSCSSRGALSAPTWNTDGRRGPYTAAPVSESVTLTRRVRRRRRAMRRGRMADNLLFLAVFLSYLYSTMEYMQAVAVRLNPGEELKSSIQVFADYQ